MKKILLLPLLIIPMFFFHNPVTTAEATYAPNQVVNGGFETGDFSGWTKSYIWKGETGIMAFDDTLITNGTYFSSYPYNRDGAYNLGITSGSITWDQTSERMGYLRSTNFTLGGSGWMSFKMGGARYASFAYISVRKSADDVEVARFGNRWFNNTDRATTVYGSAITNAEAFLYPYYFDLTTVTSLGTGLYIQLCDTSAYDWSIISADSFVTYYSSAPSPVADAMAYDIKPAILGIDTATNVIPNSGFDTNLDNWTIGLKADGTSEGNWAWANVETGNGGAVSNGNSTGNGGMGVIRSSAFTMDTNKYIRVNWGGGITYDKRIFMSLKEVGTNIEKLRFVRRDNLSGEASANLNQHGLDCSSLDSSKKYYFELSDNKSDDWGVNFVSSVAVVTETTYNGYPTGDRAVSITPMATTFPATAYTAALEAQTYASDFISQTASYCSATDGGAMATSGTWTALSDAYATLSADAKDYFVASGTTDETVKDARARYLILINTYSALYATKFVVDSSDTPYLVASRNVSSFVNNDMSTMMIVMISGLALAAFSFLFFKRKRVNQ